MKTRLNTALAAALLLAAAGTGAADTVQLAAKKVAQVSGGDGSTYVIENLGNPMLSKESDVEFVTTPGNGQKIAWGVITSPDRHGVQGVNLTTGEVHWIDTTADFGPHAHRTELAPCGNDVIYDFAGDQIKIYKDTVSTRKLVKLHTFAKGIGRSWIASRAVGPDGKIYVGTYPRTIAIGIDPATDKGFNLEPVTEDKDQRYLSAPAIDDDNVMYAPIGRVRPELFAVNLKTGAKKQILTPDQIAALLKENTYIPSVYLYLGKVYTTIGEQRYCCTPNGLAKADSARIPWPDHPDRIKANGRFPSRMINDTEEAVGFGEKSVIVADRNGKRRAITAATVPVPHEIYRFGSRRGDVLFGSGIFPANAFGLNLKTLQAMDYGRCSSGGTQSYDLLDTPDGLLISSYTGATLDLFEPDRPKGQGNPVNLARLELTDQQERMPRLTRVGDKVYTGSQPIKGYLNGAVVRVDLPSRKVTVFRGVIPDQSIPDLVLCPDGKTLFGNGSILGGTGSTPKAKTASIFLWDTATDKVIWSGTVFPEAIYYSESGLTADGKVITFGRNSANAEAKVYYYLVFDPATREVVTKGTIPASFKRYLVSHPEPMGPAKRNYFAADGSLYAYDPALKKVVKLFSHPSLDLAQDLYVTPEGYAYYLDNNTSIARVKLF
ncbi:MAG: hypothetical protein AB7F32_09870 [Victivallaceae bacterium]